jgi:hypothetical protein
MATYNEIEQTLTFENGNQLDHLQIVNLKGNFTANEVREDLMSRLESLEESGWDKDQVDEFYDWLELNQ